MAAPLAPPYLETISGQSVAAPLAPYSRQCTVRVPGVVPEDDDHRRPMALRKHAESQGNNGQAQSPCSDTAVLARDAWYEKKVCPYLFHTRTITNGPLATKAMVLSLPNGNEYLANIECDLKTCSQTCTQPSSEGHGKEQQEGACLHITRTQHSLTKKGFQSL